MAEKKRVTEEIVDRLIIEESLDDSDRDSLVDWLDKQLKHRSERLLREVARKAVDAGAAKFAS